MALADTLNDLRSGVRMLQVAGGADPTEVGATTDETEIAAHAAQFLPPALIGTLAGLGAALIEVGEHVVDIETPGP